MMAAGLLYIAFFALAAAMTRHAPVLLGPWQRHPIARHLASVGWIAIGASLLCAIMTGDDGIAFVTWCGLLPLMAGLVLVGLTYGARALRGGVVVAMILVTIGAI